MSQSGALSGKFSAVNGHGSIGRWFLARQKEAEAIVNSATRGGTARNPMRGEWSGGMEQSGGVPPVMPGEVFAFDGYTAPRTGVEGTVGDSYAGSALCTEAVIVWDWADNKIISNTIAFEGKGVLTNDPAAAAIADATTLIKETSKGRIIEHLTAPVTYTEITGRKKATLTLSIASGPVKNSDTLDETEREGGALDWNLAIELDETGVPLAEDLEVEELRLWVNATEYYDISYGLVGETTGLEVKPGSVDIIGQTLNIRMQAVKADGTPGRIILPDLTTLWTAVP